MDKNSGKKITVTKTFLPPLEEYELYVKKIWAQGQLTNQGPLLREFEEKASNYLGVKNFHFVANGTLALQLAINSLDITEGEIITTPFSYVATTSALLWERCSPVYVDIDADTLCINPNKIELAITDKTKAILAVHVFGNPCDVDAIDKIAKKYKLKVIYDAAHAFGVNYEGKSLLDRGDISICSFHATKPFHTIEGGCIITKDKSVSEKVELIKRFGHNYDEHYMLGINAKASEFNAAMGICNLHYIEEIIQIRKKVSNMYDEQITGKITKIKISKQVDYNYAYYPIILSSEEELLKKKQLLEEKNIFPRRYFYPSLNTLPYLNSAQSCPISEKISKRILCLPLYESLEKKDIQSICETINA